jgi:hypothetical protein
MPPPTRGDLGLVSPRAQLWRRTITAKGDNRSALGRVRQKSRSRLSLGGGQSSRFGRITCRMSYRLRIRLAAEADVAEAAQWYNERQLGFGEKFIRRKWAARESDAQYLEKMQRVFHSCRAGTILSKSLPSNESNAAL